MAGFFNKKGFFNNAKRKFEPKAFSKTNSTRN
jgi:hypothetical protein